MIISVASGKGGTGKTTVATSLALSLSNVQFLDCDVEEPNAHIFLSPFIEEREKVTIPVPRIDEKKCTFCRMCQEACRFNALVVLPESVLTFDQLCHGCGTCSYVCPEDAISEKDREIGWVERGSVGEMAFVQGLLNIGEPMPTPVIRAVKGSLDKEKTVIIDAPPGTSCPMVESVNGSDFCLLVTEPSPFGLYDLRLAVEVVRLLDVPFGVIINRSDIGNRDVTEFCQQEGIPVLAEIPNDFNIARAYAQGVTMVLAVPRYRETMIEIYRKLS